jgi:hypothetical protein
VRLQHLFMTEYVLRMLGLVHCQDTLVGDALTRGVSGGERRWVLACCCVLWRVQPATRPHLHQAPARPFPHVLWAFIRQ